MNIVHTCKTMTVRQYARFEATGDSRDLLRVRLVPVRLVRDQVQAFITEFNSLFNTSGDDYIIKQAEQMAAYNKLMMLQAIADGIRVHITTRAEMGILANRIGYRLPDDKNLAEYITLVKDTTGIEIKTLEDVKAFSDELQRKIDKYNEKYSRPDQTGSDRKTTMLELFTACCAIMEVTHDYTRMTLWEFSQFKRQAERQARRREEALQKSKSI